MTAKRQIDDWEKDTFSRKYFRLTYEDNRLPVFFKFRYDYADSGPFSQWDNVIKYFEDTIREDEIEIAGVYVREETLGKDLEQVKRHCHFNFFSTAFTTYSSANAWTERVKQRWRRDKTSGFKHKNLCVAFTACTDSDKLRSEDNLLQYPLKHVDVLQDHIYNPRFFYEHLPDWNIQLRWESAKAHAIDCANRREKALEKMAQRSTYEVLLDKLAELPKDKLPKSDFEIFEFILTYLEKERMPLDAPKVRNWVLSLALHLKITTRERAFQKVMGF